MVRRIISVFSAFVIIFSCCSLAYADIVDSGSYIASNFWDFLQGKEFDYNADFWKNVTGYFVGQECPSSPDKYHHGPKPAFGSGTGGSDENGRFSWVICDHCGKQFKVYSSFVGGSGGGFGKSDLQQSYEAQVAELPAPSYNSDGSLLIPFTVTEHQFYTSGQNPLCNKHKSKTFVRSAYTVHFSCSDNIIFVTLNSGYSYFSFPRIGYTLYSSLVIPYDGYYSIWKPKIHCTYTVPGGTSESITFGSGSDMFPSGLGVYYTGGKEISCNLNDYISNNSQFFSVSLSCSTPLAKFTPASSVDINFNTTYNITSRPTSITGDYGIIGDNGQIIKVEGDKIVNETNNTIYNPATGETHTLSDWSYNYEDRSYTVTTETGDTITVTYGDENVTIKEGDTIYNIYYLVDGSGSETPGPGPDVCDHSWTETGRTDPTCTTPGKVTSICSKCSQTKTDPIPATGHSWVVDRTVQTTYDEEGNLLQQGYTIYSCTVCGEQYKDMEGTGPPGAEEEKSIWEKLGDLIGTGFGGLIEIIEAILSKILDALTSLVDMLVGQFKHIVESILSLFDELPALFGGFLDFLRAIFPFLPPEITTILTFGVIAITFIGILKAVRR